MSVEVELQRALYLALNGIGLTAVDSAAQASDAGSATGWPYVEVGATVAAPFDTANSTGFDVVARIHTHSRAAGMLECKTIQGLIYDRLHRGALTVTGYQTITVERQLSRCDRVADKSFHGICEYRVMLTAA